jgi:hypothetical protein
MTVKAGRVSQIRRTAVKDQAPFPELIGTRLRNTVRATMKSAGAPPTPQAVLFDAYGTVFDV